MLNEINEYNAFLSEGYEGLLAKSMSREFSGLCHAMVILARGMGEKLGLFEQGESALSPDQQFRCLKGFLRVWFAGGWNPAEYPELQNRPEIVADFQRANQYNLKAYFVDRKLPPEGAALEKLFKEELDSFEGSPFSNLTSHNKHRIFFNGVIADALHNGPLRKMQLVIRGDAPKKKSTKTKDNTFGICCLQKKDGHTTVDWASYKQRSKILAIVACYLQDKAGNQLYVDKCRADIANYIGIKTSSDGKFGGVGDFINKGAFGFKKVDKETGTKTVLPLIYNDPSTHKFAFNEQWIEEYGVHLVPEDTPTPDGCITFFDEDLRK